MKSALKVSADDADSSAVGQQADVRLLGVLTAHREAVLDALAHPGRHRLPSWEVHFLETSFPSVSNSAILFWPSFVR